MTQDRFLRLATSLLVTFSLVLTSCGGREGASPALLLLIAGDNHILAIKKDGTLWAWGHNCSGAAEGGTSADSNTPVQIAK